MHDLLSAAFLLAAGESGSLLYDYNAWRVLNLLIFVLALYFFLRRPIGEVFRTRREAIKRELAQARQERDAALAKLQEVEARLARLDQEVAEARAEAEREAAEERERIRRNAEEEARRLRDQAEREIEAAAKAARARLREFAAEQSVRLAEEMIRREMRPEDEARLISRYVEELGGDRR
jgi:F-type H+-transporting ATPase subunit b